MHAVDIAIITVIPEEYAAVVKRLRRPRPPAPSETSPSLYAWTCGEIVHYQNKRPFRVVVAMATDPGTISGALVTEKTIARWSPRYVLLVGIAGGFNPGQQLSDEERLNLGDVVLSEVIWGYEYGKITKTFKPRNDKTFRADRGLLPSAVAFSKLDKSWARPKAIGTTPPGEGIKRQPHVVSGPVASGDKVVDDPGQDFFVQVIDAWPKLRGIEMEGAGAAAAIEIAQAEGRSIGFLMIRGISDLPRPTDLVDPSHPSASVHPSERDRWKQFAANAAASFTIAFISKMWPLAPRSDVAVDNSEVPQRLDTNNTGGGSNSSGRGQEISRSKAVLFYQADYEMLENSRAFSNGKGYEVITDVLQLELRLVFLAMPSDAHIIIPPSYYYELQLCRELIQRHAPLIEAGFIRLSVDYPDLRDYLEVKKDRYTKARHIERFRQAYYSRKRFGIEDLPFRLVSKSSSVGLRTLDLWNVQLIRRASYLGFPTDKLNEFRKRALDTEKSAILYENLTEHMARAGITHSEARALRVRDIMNRNYLRAYVENGIAVPTGSRIIWDALTADVPHSIYQLDVWSRIFESLNLISTIMRSSCKRLLRIKFSPENALILEDIRVGLEKGERCDSINGRLHSTGLGAVLARQFREAA